jgi:hypothetical protein
MVELLEMRHEVAAPLGGAGMDDEFARDVIEPSIATFLACQGAGTRKFGARLRPHPRELALYLCLPIMPSECTGYEAISPTVCGAVHLCRAQGACVRHCNMPGN